MVLLVVGGLTLLVACSGPGFSQESARRTGLTQIVPVSSESKTRISPLERLKARSAADRWREATAPGRHRPFWRPGAPQAATEAAPEATVPRATERVQPAPPAPPAVPAQAKAAAAEDDSPQELPPEVPIPETRWEDDDAAELKPVPEATPLPARDDRQAAIDRKAPSRRPAAAETPAMLVARQMENLPYSEPVRDPNQLKKLTAISPYSDYEPDADVISRDRCQNLCPRPLDENCPDCPNQPAPGEPRVAGADCPECPEEVRLSGIPYSFRNFPRADYCWEAPDLWHYPLYFEDIPLERYGHTRHYIIQPFVSVPRFMFQLGMMPYQLTIDPVYKVRYTLGLYRPGEHVPYMYYQMPWNLQAALVQAGTVTGSYFLFSPATGP